MKNSLFLGSALGVLLFAGSASAAIHTYKATLNAEQQPGNVTSEATGTATVEFNDETKEITGTIEYTGLTVTLAHIHEGACGTEGAPIFDFEDGVESPIEFSGELNDDEVAALEAGNLYVNLHSAQYENGEIRGQLYLEGSGQTCPAGNPDADAGTDAGSSSGDNSSGGSSGGDNSSGGTSGSVAPASTEDSSGCSTTGTGSSGSGVALALGVGLAMAIARGRKGKKA